jgi:hypothetical protein
MKTIADTAMLTSPEYRQFIEDLKARVTAARISAARAVNRDLVLLYWDIGRTIVEKQQTLGWGDSVVEMISADLRRAFPAMTGFSVANVWRMRQLYETYRSSEFLAQAVRELGPTPDGSKENEYLAQAVRDLAVSVPWGHQVLLLGRIKDPAAQSA